MRINKFIAGAGVASRRKADELVAAGKVKVNGVVITEAGYDVDEKNDTVTIGGKKLTLAEDKVYYMLNKPVDVISASSADHGDRTVIDLIDDKEHRLFPVGRLDKDSEGLIFITNDGDFSYVLTHPRFEKQKKYVAILKGEIDEKDLRKLTKGVMLDDKIAIANYVRLDKVIKGNSRVEIIISEGRNRQIRRMCEIIGHPVLSLRRIEEAGISLGNLKTGEYRALTDKEVKTCLSYKRSLEEKDGKPDNNKGPKHDGKKPYKASRPAEGDHRGQRSGDTAGSRFGRENGGRKAPSKPYEKSTKKFKNVTEKVDKKK